MRTTSVLIQSLCVPCCNRCRYCLLAWNGKTEGAAWDRSINTAERFLQELRDERPDLKCSFSFGYSMEHPDLQGSIRTLRRLGSPTAEFMQCDGMKMRDETECYELMDMLSAEGIRELNFTIYGLPDYHDRFAGRKGDFKLIVRMMKAAKDAGLSFTAGIPLTIENISQADELVRTVNTIGSSKVFLFIPHEEGRGILLNSVRLGKSDLGQLSSETRKLLNENLYRSESDWLKDKDPAYAEHRHILISLRNDNIDDYENRSALSVLHEIEALDENYYAAFPSFAELVEIYGETDRDKLYRIRDLFYHYRMLYAHDKGLNIYDVMDERLSGSRRF